MAASYTSWPLGILPSNTPENSPFKYVNNIITSSSANGVFINATKASTNAALLFNVPSIGGIFITNNIISTQYPDGTSTNQGASYASQNVMNLQSNDFALEALITQGYNSLVRGLFTQFGLVSNIITSMLAYGNTDLLSTSDTDIITQWPHDIYSNMLTINDAMTYSVRSLGIYSDDAINYANISEWRWIYPNRSRCQPPTTLNLTSMILPSMNITNTIAYPTGLFRWDILRFDFFNPAILLTSLDRNSLLDSNLLIENNVFTVVYDNVAAPGCILLFLKIAINYNDGTGSVDNNGVNTSRRVLNPTYTINDIEYPTVFRVGMEWLENFISIMTICSPVESPSSKILFYGGDLNFTLTQLSNSYLGCKRLYMWRLVHDLMVSRITNTNGTIHIVDSIINGDEIVSNSVPGIYLCLLSGSTDYSTLTPFSPFIPEPIWQNFWYPLSQFDNSNTTICSLTSVEIQAYLTPSFVNEGIPVNKYGVIRILVGDNDIPLQEVTSSQFSYSDPDFNTIPANICYSDTVNCWFPLTSYSVPITNPGTQVNINNYWLYLFIFIIVFCIVVFILYYIFKHKEIQAAEPEKVSHVPPPPSSSSSSSSPSSSSSSFPPS